MRDGPVNCRNATLYEAQRGQHLTWEDDGVCKPCKRTIERFIKRGTTQSVVDDDEDDDESNRVVETTVTVHLRVVTDEFPDGLLSDTEN